MVFLHFLTIFMSKMHIHFSKSGDVLLFITVVPLYLFCVIPFLNYQYTLLNIRKQASSFANSFLYMQTLYMQSRLQQIKYCTQQINMQNYFRIYPNYIGNTTDIQLILYIIVKPPAKGKRLRYNRY